MENITHSKIKELLASTIDWKTYGKWAFSNQINTQNGYVAAAKAAQYIKDLCVIWFRRSIFDWPEMLQGFDGEFSGFGCRGGLISALILTQTPTYSGL